MARAVTVLAVGERLELEDLGDVPWVGGGGVGGGDGGGDGGCLWWPSETRCGGEVVVAFLHTYPASICVSLPIVVLSLSMYPPISGSLYLILSGSTKT